MHYQKLKGGNIGSSLAAPRVCGSFGDKLCRPLITSWSSVYCWKLARLTSWDAMVQPAFRSFYALWAVAWAGIYWRWTPNPYLLGLLSVGAAYMATLAVDRLMHRRSNRRPL